MESDVIELFKFLSNEEDKDIVDYLKSLGGNDELFNDVEKWMDELFKDLNTYTTDDCPLSTFYGTSIDKHISICI